MPSLTLRTVTCPRCGTTTTLHVGRAVPESSLLVCCAPSCRAVFPVAAGVEGGSARDLAGYLTREWIAAYGDTSPEQYDWDAVDAAAGDTIAPLADFVAPEPMLPGVRAAVRAVLPS